MTMATNDDATTIAQLGSDSITFRDSAGELQDWDVIHAATVFTRETLRAEVGQ